MLLLFWSAVFAQSDVQRFLTPSDSLHVPRRNAVVITEAGLSVGALALLGGYWYSDYPKSNFHFINDNAEWLQMDKAGHVFSAYHLSNYTSEALRWSGVSDKDRILYGAATGFLFLSAIEVLDGYSSNWGASAGDLIANATGTGLFVSQELLWKEQRITPKFSFHTTEYASARPNVLGRSFTEQLLKDYNGQTYWLSVNLWSFWKASQIPKWLNVAVGYGAEGMITGNDDLVNTVFLPEKQRYRQFLFSIDADLTKIETRSHFLKTLFSAVNTIKIPAPALEFNTKGRTRIHAFYF